MRQQLFSGNEENMFSIIGPILLDLILYHDRASCEPATVASIITFLAGANPLQLAPIPGVPLDTSQIEASIADQKAESSCLFNRFNKQQSEAIKHWLQTVLLWQVPHLPEDEVKSALAYWETK